MSKTNLSPFWYSIPLTDLQNFLIASAASSNSTETITVYRCPDPERSCPPTKLFMGMDEV